MGVSISIGNNPIGTGSGVWPTSERFRVGYRQLWFEDVDLQRLGEIDSAFVDELGLLIKAGGVDMSRIAEAIERAKRKTVASLEDQPDSALINPIIKHFVYAASNSVGIEGIGGRIVGALSPSCRRSS